MGAATLTVAARRLSQVGHRRKVSIYALGGIKPQIATSAWVAPTAAVMGNVVLKEGSSVWFGATIRGDSDTPITVGERSNIQDGSTLHSDDGVALTVGDNVTIGHMVMLHGCTVGDNSLVGIGATILNNAVIGRNCLIGAHSLVPEGRTIPDGSLVMGSPAKVVKSLTAEQTALLAGAADHYVENAKRFREELTPLD